LKVKKAGLFQVQIPYVLRTFLTASLATLPELA
jgi:hypothetical protein